MADDTLTTKALEKIASFEVEIGRLKIFVNEADKLNGLEPRFGDLNAAAGPGTLSAAKPNVKKWQAGEFFNKPFSTVVRQILLARAEASGGPSPASVDEIHEALTQGSFAFETTGVEQQKNSLRISLGKNSAAFARLPNSDLFGLVEWYGKKAGRPGRRSALPVEDDASGFAEATAGAEDEETNKLPVADRAA